MVRHFISQLQLDVFVYSCMGATGAERDTITDKTHEILIQLLANEAKYADSFENMAAFLGYLKVSVVRQVVAEMKRSRKFALLEDTHPTQTTPEMELVAALEQASFRNVLEEVLAKTRISPRAQRELRELVRLLLSSDEFIHPRQSGTQKSVLVFDVSGLASRLGWTRGAVYKRLEQLRSALSFAGAKAGREP